PSGVRPSRCCISKGALVEGPEVDHRLDPGQGIHEALMLHACNETFATGKEKMKSHRPTIMGTRHMISATQYLAAEAGFKILEAGGNGIDRGVAGGGAGGECARG